MKVPLDASRPLGAIVVGRAGMDLYPTPDGTRIEEATSFAAEIGGSAGNIAVAIARHGFRTALITCLSDDAVGRFVSAALARLSVDTGRCRLVKGDYRTSLALAETRKEDCSVVIYRNQAADLQLRADDFDPAQIASAAVLVVTGTALVGDPSRSAVMHALALARATNTFTILDIDHRAYSWPSNEVAAKVYLEAARLCDAVVGNDDEFALLASGEPIAAAREFVAGGGNFAVLKKGAGGSTTLTSRGETDAGIFPVQVKKPFGAGDAFLGTLVAGLLSGADLQAAVVRSSAAAAFVVSRRGCAFAMPTPAELDQFIAEYPTPKAAHAHPAVRQ
ncbi:MAG TPA: 5-dehydro-2-deoxygluconokinase [Bauldia sp.]|nr:5-dehydro-2-deoxygluconokinase [Bauldia sp.]